MFLRQGVRSHVPDLERVYNLRLKSEIMLPNSKPKGPFCPDKTTTDKAFCILTIFLPGILVWSSHWCPASSRDLSSHKQLSSQNCRWACCHRERTPQDGGCITSVWTEQDGKSSSNSSQHAHTNSLWTEDNSVTASRNLFSDISSCVLYSLSLQCFQNICNCFMGFFKIFPVVYIVIQIIYCNSPK